MTLPVDLISEIQKLAPSSIIELFILDATGIGGSTFYFHAGTNGLRQNVVWQGQTYIRFPVAVTGFEMNGQGQFPRPKLQVANTLSVITQVLMSTNDLLGAKVTRRRTFAKFLDAVNFSGGVNPTADDTAEFTDDVFYIDRKSNEDRDMVEFELAASVDLAGVVLPRRQIIQNICTWKYRGAECGYTGPPLYEEGDTPITIAQTTQGQAVITALVNVASAQKALYLSEQALSAAAQAKAPACEIVMLDRLIDDTNFMSTFMLVYGVKGSPFSVVAYWNGSPVDLGPNYRMGPLWSTVYVNGVKFDLYYIERWDVDSGASSAATAVYNTALADRDAKQAALNTAQAALDTASAALPTDDPLLSADVCGKRLSSCKLRFGTNNPLPFGSFPAAGLTV